jgi:hypothetical protein
MSITMAAVVAMATATAIAMAVVAVMATAMVAEQWHNNQLKEGGNGGDGGCR